ncbi:PREDICTED: uncharacterized protein LOC109471299 [Branchiostoma belcheri]|uniref:Uncharacterized protein LOC109471299 n=1 Tax=Branchiostoma belcheri TaxID=7741 RepID=A0A6P4YAR0_BRABE|nr:PREDICTED: uncharacterized protein LOC109471299 [Branchiostoma belcheri]
MHFSERRLQTRTMQARNAEVPAADRDQVYHLVVKCRQRCPRFDCGRYFRLSATVTDRQHTQDVSADNAMALAEAQLVLSATCPHCHNICNIPAERRTQDNQDQVQAAYGASDVQGNPVCQPTDPRGQ